MTKICHSTILSFPFFFFFIFVSCHQQHYCKQSTTTCTHDSHTPFQLTPDVQLCVNRIDYASQSLHLYDPQQCLPSQLLKLLNSSISPFTYYNSNSSPNKYNFTFFNCSSLDRPRIRRRDDLYYKSPDDNVWRNKQQQEQDMLCCPIYGADSNEFFLDSDLFSCSKILDTAKFMLYSPELLQQNSLMLKWSEPDCAACEARGRKCGLVSNGASRGVQCLPRRPSVPKSTIVAATTGGIVGLILLLTVLLTSFRVYRNSRMKEEDQARVEKFLEDYAARRPTRFSYTDINRITNGFRDKLGEGAHGAVFKGKLSNEILVAVKKLNNSELILDDNDEKEFINEVGTMGKIHHLNVVRLLGFCADGFHRALVYDFFPNGSLDNFLCPPHTPPEPSTGSVLHNGDLFLGWEKLQEITIGIARGIEYLHMGCDYQILHFDINPHNVLLDENFTPKISDFGLAKLCSKNQSAVSITAARGTLGYIAPEVFSRNFGNVSNKSDVYSFGMLLAEMVGGRKNTTSTSEENFHVLYPKWIHGLIEGGGGEEEVHIQIEDEEDMRIAKKLAIVVLWCIQWHPMDRPSIKTVLQMLEGKGDKLKVPPTPLDSSSSSNIASVVVPPRRLNLELEVIHELE